MYKNRVASIISANGSEAQQKIERAVAVSDLIELRLDYWNVLNIEEVAHLCRQITVPVIFTLRKKSQGGRCEMDEAKRLLFIEELASLSPEYIDLEYDVSETFISELRKKHPSIRLIGSYHDFKKTSDDLEKLFQETNRPQFDVSKIAVFANDITDTLRFLIFLRNISQTRRVIGMAMGEFGQISRILAPVAGSLFTYGCLDEDFSAAPGQLTLSDLTHIYRVHHLNRETQVYALLGDPVIQSPGHLFHNEQFALENKNAVYVKLRVTADKLAPAILLLRKLPFEGFSVTIPYKETIVPLLDAFSEEAAKMRIVNTIKRKGQQYCGYNTDGAGAVDVLENIKPLAHQKILILGAGGSAKALAYALISKGAEITLCNRTLSRALAFTKEYGGQAITFDELFTMKTGQYDMMINTLPGEAFASQCANWEIPRVKQGIAMDIVLKPLTTVFIQRAEAAGWRCLRGDALFIAQALRQQEIWGSSSP